MRVCSFKWCVLLLHASLVSLSLSGCTSFLGATLPPGAAGGTFSQNPKGVPKMSRVMYGHQMDLNSAAIQRMQMQFRVLRLLKITSKDFQKQFLRQATTWERTFTDLSQLKGRDVDLVLEGAHWAVELDALLFSVWKDYRDYLPYASEPDIYAPARGANLLDKQTRMKGGILVLAAEMLRMDNTAVLIEAANKVPQLPFLMNRGDDKHGVPGESYDRMIGQYYEPDRRTLLKKYLLDVEFSRHELNSIAAKDTEVAFALAVIHQSKSANLLRSEKAFSRQRNYSSVVLHRTWESFFSPVYNWQLQKALKQTKGKKREKLQTVAEIKGATESFFDNLEPMDVLLIGEEKRTSSGEKARFDHAVIYLGNFRAMTDQGFGEHPAMNLYGTQLRLGKVFLELAGNGIKLWRFEDMLQINEVVVLRYAKNRLNQVPTLGEAAPPASEEEENTGADETGITVGEDAVDGFNRPTADLVQDTDMGDLATRATEQTNWRDYGLRDSQINKLTERALDLMTRPEFVSPPSLTDLERSSLLLSSIFGMAELGVSLRSGQNVASLKQMLTAAVVIDGLADIPFVSLKGAFAQQGAAKALLIRSMAQNP